MPFQKVTFANKSNIKKDLNQLIYLLFNIYNLISGYISPSILLSFYKSLLETNMDTLVHIGRRIKVIREKKKITQEELEGKTGINAKYISAVERGQKNVTIKTLEKIAKGLDVELYQLFLFSEDFTSEKAAKKALESLIKEADLKTLNLCLDFIRKALA